MNTITLHMENRADNTAVSNYFIDTLSHRQMVNL